jgi:alpha-N-arabinofuranosidase
MMTHCADHMDLISEHFYNRNKDDLLEHVRQIPNNVKRIADAHRDYRKRFDSLKGKDIRIALDEWNYWYGAHVFGELGTRYFMQDALGVAAGLHEYFRNSDIIFMANYAQTVNVIGAIKTSKTAVSFAATGLPLKLYRNEFGTIPIVVDTQPESLDVSAAWTEDRKAITVAVVNITKQKYNLTLNIENARLTGKAKCWLIRHSDLMAYNEPGKKPQIVIEEKRISRMSDILNVPPQSITLYRLDVR